MTSSNPIPGNFQPNPQHEVMGDDHVGTSVDTPLRPDAFALTDEEKMARIAPIVSGNHGGDGAGSQR